jgi:uncharacterized protein (TIGR02444 family)
MTGPGLWDWALRAYAAPEVAPLCLTLQDRHGQSVCLLLWAGWAATNGRRLTPPVVDAAAGLARRWAEAVIDPLRAARRGLKAAPGIAEAERQGLVARLQADELTAEQALLRALEALTPGADGPPHAVAAALAAAVAAWGRPAPEAMLAALADAFPNR